MSQLPGGVAVFPSAPVAIRNNDVEHEYRQDSDFYYLTGFDEPEAVLVLATCHPQHRTVLFVRPRDPEREVWDGARAGVDGAVREFEADVAFPIAELAARLPEYLQDHDKVLYRVGRDRAFDDRVFAALDATRARARRGIGYPTEIVDPSAVLHEMRLLKSSGELDAMRKAAAITREAHIGAMRLAKPGRYEYEVEALLREVFRKNGSERPAYPPIVGSGVNATVLHYRSNAKRIEEGELLLLIALGLLNGDREKNITENLYVPFFMHRTSHWLGMDVHDVGAYFRAKKPRPLEAGMVLTVEPGIYIAANNTAVPPAYRGIGVRIEDDILVTPEGYLNLTADIPKMPNELESACA